MHGLMFNEQDTFLLVGVQGSGTLAPLLVPRCVLLDVSRGDHAVYPDS